MYTVAIGPNPMCLFSMGAASRISAIKKAVKKHGSNDQLDMPSAHVRVMMGIDNEKLLLDFLKCRDLVIVCLKVTDHHMTWIYENGDKGKMIKKNATGGVSYR